MTDEEILAQIKGLGFTVQTWVVSGLTLPKQVDKRIREYHIRVMCEHGVVYKLSSTVSMSDATHKMLGVVKAVTHKEI